MRQRQIRGYSGHLFEEEVLGRCLIIWDGSYRSYEKSMQMVKENQPSDPVSPTCRTSRTMHRQVALALGVEEWKELGLFTAVGSPLDYFHGVDAFFEWHGCVVTVDVTTNPLKQEAKADIVFHEDDDMDAFVRHVVEEFSLKEESMSHVS